MTNETQNVTKFNPIATASFFCRASVEINSLAASTFAAAQCRMSNERQPVVGLVGFPPERAVFRPGLFAETFTAALPHRVALLHLDCDWYDSVLAGLRTFYPRIPDGGIVVLDDFGFWEGTRRAFYAFCREFDVEPLLEHEGSTQAYWIKGREHNRG